MPRADTIVWIDHEAQVRGACDLARHHSLRSDREVAAFPARLTPETPTSPSPR